MCPRMEAGTRSVPGPGLEAPSFLVAFFPLPCAWPTLSLSRLTAESESQEGGRRPLLLPQRPASTGWDSTEPPAAGSPGGAPRLVAVGVPHTPSPRLSSVSN